MCERFVVPLICSRDVAWAEWPYIRRFEHFLKLLDVVNDAFNVHASQYLTRGWQSSNASASACGAWPPLMKRNTI
jgi:hypothetical protein